MKVLLASALVLASFGLAPSNEHAISIQQRGAPSVQQKITTFLWFDQNAEEAVRFYTSIFKDSKILEENRWGAGAPVPEGTLMSARIRLAGQELIAFNGGPTFKFTEAISLVVQCQTQKEVDEYWAKLTDGGQEVECGWLKDRYGLSWQIVPTVLLELLRDKDAGKRQRVMQAMLQMRKLDVDALKRAADGR